MAGALLHQVRALLVATFLQKSRIWRLTPTSGNCSRIRRSSLFHFRLASRLPRPALIYQKNWVTRDSCFMPGVRGTVLMTFETEGLIQSRSNQADFGECVVLSRLSHHVLLLA
jgi:hypothetical protein